MGEVRLKYTMDQANAYRRELKRLPAEFLNNKEEVCKLALETARTFQEAASTEMIGCGADYGTAWYAHAKMYEAVGLPSASSGQRELVSCELFCERCKTDTDHGVCGKRQ